MEFCYTLGWYRDDFPTFHGRRLDFYHVTLLFRSVSDSKCEVVFCFKDWQLSVVIFHPNCQLRHVSSIEPLHCHLAHANSGAGIMKHRLFKKYFFVGARIYAMRIILAHAMVIVDCALESPESQLSNTPEINSISHLVDELSSIENEAISHFFIIFACVF